MSDLSPYPPVPPEVGRPRNAGQRPQGKQGTPPRSRFRRSRKVLIVKIVLPLSAVALVGLVFAWPQLQSDNEDFRLDATTPVSDGQSAKPQVLNPRLSGVDEDGQPFEVTADIATAVVSEEGREVYYLTRPNADISLSGGAWVALSAAEGVYEAATEILTLRDGVSLFHDSGVEFQTESARILMAQNAAESDQPVHGFGEFGEIRSAGIRIIDGGNRIVFTGPAQLLLVGSDRDIFARRTAPPTEEVATQAER